MNRHVGGQAVVLGGGIAGLLAAKVLAPAFTSILLVDRDDLIGERDARRGVPHGRHAHGLVARGHQILEEQFPGLTDQMVAAGVKPGDFNGDIRWYINGARLRPSTSGLLSVPATRPVLEEQLRLRVQQIPNLTFLERHDILGLTTTADNARVTGVRVQPRDDTGEPRTLEADLVIDTTGRGSRTPAWLEELGYGRPPEERVKIDLAYTTRHFRLDHDPFGDDLAIIPAPTPQHPRGAFFYRVPGEGKVELSLTGMLGDHPPTDPEGFLEFARSLPVPQIYEAVRDAEPVDDAVMFRFPASVWRHYERMSRFPAGLLVMGDAVCSFNPLYAQGMTVAAMESLTLGKHLERGLPQPLAFLRDIAGDIGQPWALSAGADLAYPGVEGRRTLKTKFINAYVARLQLAAVHDAVLTNAFIRSAGLIDPPQALLHPRNLVRVLRSFFGQTPTAPSKVAPPVAVRSATE
jgi:2-polyprenyl-6-methoxyphenol hydroxylase-like FAD-dependent oxidoreductase